MKGLLYKDLSLMKNQIAFMVLIGVISVGCSGAMKNPFFAMGYATSFFSIFSISTISYDEYDNGMPYLFTLPINRKIYVKEKYSFAFLLVFFSMLLSGILSAVIAAVMKIKYPMEDWIMMIATSVALVTVILSIMLPTKMKFDSEKQRMAVMVIMGGLGVFLGGIYALLIAFGIDIFPFIETVLFVNPWTTLGCSVVGAVAFIGISYRISLKIMEKREF